MMDRLDDIFVVAGEVEEAPAFAGRSKLRQDVFACQRHEIVGRIDLEVCSNMAKDPWCVVLEFEIVLCRWRQFVASAEGMLAPILSPYAVCLTCRMKTYAARQSHCL